MDDHIRDLERKFQATSAHADWRRLQLARRRAQMPYGRAQVDSYQSEERTIRYFFGEGRSAFAQIPQGTMLANTKLTNGWRIETWWDENFWPDDDIEGQGQPIAWTTLVYDDEENQVGNAIHCSTIECALGCHQIRTDEIISGSIETFDGQRPLHDAEPRRNPDTSYYHGSPYSGMKSTTDFEGDYLFLTPSHRVAVEYTSGLLASAKRPKLVEVEDVKTVYEMQVNLLPEQVFDTRNPQHKQLYYEIRDDLKKQLDPEDWPSRNLISSPPLYDSAVDTSGTFPDFGSGLYIIPALIERGFRALWVSEGSQGASLALFYPQDATIVNFEHIYS